MNQKKHTDSIGYWKYCNVGRLYFICNLLLRTSNGLYLNECLGEDDIRENFQLCRA